MAKKAKRTTKTASGASVAIYGTARTGSGWIAETADGRLLGTGEVLEGRSATDALWLACDALRAAGVALGTVDVTIDSAAGPLVARTDVRSPCSFGSLRWEANPVRFVLSAEAVLAAAEEV